jgi:CopG family transcriptional regulator, nickel-responsive regulator
MERVTVSLDDELLGQFDEFIKRKGYANRSEAVRDLLRDRLQADQLSSHNAAPYCVGSLFYVYNHHERELSRRITQIHHDHHDLIRSTMHVHLDHENCVEVSLLEGPTPAVAALADAISSETGVRHGKVNLLPVEKDAGHAHHGHHPHHHHHHVGPKT